MWNSDKDGREAFHLQLQAVIQKISKHDIVVGGDFNATGRQKKNIFEGAFQNFSEPRDINLNLVSFEKKLKKGTTKMNLNVALF